MGFLLFACATFAQQSNTPYDFPVKPGSQKWESFKSVEDMYAACQVPADVLNKLSTTALIQTCLNYPASVVLFMHSTPQMSFDEWKQHFNGIGTLVTRSDAAPRLLDYYKTVDVKGYRKFATEIEKGQYTFLLMTIDMILAQEDIISKMDLAQKRQLLNLALSNYNSITTDDLYGFVNHASTGRIIVKLAASLGDNATKSIASTKSMQEFVTTGSLGDRETFAKVINKARTISTK